MFDIQIHTRNSARFNKATSFENTQLCEGLRISVAFVWTCGDSSIVLCLCGRFSYIRLNIYISTPTIV